MRLRIMLAVTLLYIMFLLSGCGAQSSAIAEEAFKYVETMEVTSKEIVKTDVFSGRIIPSTEVNVIGKSAGEVKEVFFRVGDSVKNGDVLFRMDEKALENNIFILKSQLQGAESAIASARNMYEISRGSQKTQQLNQSESALEQTRIQYEEAKKNYGDMKLLFEKDAVSKVQLDQLKALYDQAEIAYKLAKSSHDLLLESVLEENISMSRHQLDQAISSRESLKSQLQNAKDVLNDLEVKSPIDGVVASRNVEAGELAGGGMPSFTIVNIDKVYLEVGIPENIINIITLDKIINVEVESANNGIYSGKVVQISPVPDQRTLTYPVKIEIQNNEGLIKPGMFAKAYFELEKKENVLVAPRNVFRVSDNKWSVFILENDTAKRVEVEIGIDNGSEVEIISGIKERDQIITTGRQYLRDGEFVKKLDLINKTGVE
ncbi:UNVERIFIED_CONTAM: RND family efflux transporter MFP subunit [Acetivibrio alkalicellulosi]